jgi:hypothetical protein
VRYSLLLLPLLTACATQQGPVVQVRPITPALAQASKCVHLGMVNGFAPVIIGGMPAAQRTFRNRVAAAGGNAFIISAQSISPEGHGEVVGDAYACPV